MGWNTEIWCSMKGKSDRTIGRWTDDSGEMIRGYALVVAQIPSASPSALCEYSVKSQGILRGVFLILS